MSIFFEDWSSVKIFYNTVYILVIYLIQYISLTYIAEPIKGATNI